MSTIIDEFSRNAGTVWDVLKTNSPMTQINLLRIAQLDEKQLHAAVGWLARENKIYQNGTVYELRETNLTEKIGGDAGKLWRILEAWGDVDITNITRLAHINEHDTYAALGWLARENKIEEKHGKTKDNLIRFKLR